MPYTGWNRDPNIIEGIELGYFSGNKCSHILIEVSFKNVNQAFWVIYFYVYFITRPTDIVLKFLQKLLIALTKTATEPVFQNLPRGIFPAFLRFL